MDLSERAKRRTVDGPHMRVSSAWTSTWTSDLYFPKLPQGTAVSHVGMQSCIGSSIQVGICQAPLSGVL